MKSATLVTMEDSQGVGQRDSVALDRFLGGVERRALRLAEIATGSRDEALDIVQDAMLGLARRYGNRTSSEWAPLFHRILQSRILDWHRRGQVRRRFFSWFAADDQEDDPMDRLPDPQAHRPEEILGQDRAGQALTLALRALPQRQQQVFLLRAWEGLDVAATATAMGCSQGSVKTHYSRAVHRLREELGDHWP